MQIIEMQKEFFMKNLYVEKVFEDSACILEFTKKFNYEDWKIFFGELSRKEFIDKKDLSKELIDIINKNNNIVKYPLVTVMSEYLLNKNVDDVTFAKVYLPFILSIDKNIIQKKVKIYVVKS
jgi:hypothetical protein